MPEPPGTGTVDVMTAHLPRRPAARPATGPDAASRAPRRRTTLLTGRWSRALVLAGAVAAGTITVSGCDFATDTPLSVTSTTRAVAPGDPITGKVIYPDGKITVTIAPFASPRNTKLHRTAGEKACEYHRFSKKYSCPTTDLEQGLYLVQVTDAAQPGEGTAEAQVAVTDAVTEAGGYDPHIVISNADGEAKAGPATLKLTGWRPGVAVQMRMIDENNKTVFTGDGCPRQARCRHRAHPVPQGRALQPLRHRRPVEVQRRRGRVQRRLRRPRSLLSPDANAAATDPGFGIGALFWETIPALFAVRYPNGGFIESYGDDWPSVNCIDFSIGRQSALSRRTRSASGHRRSGPMQASAHAADGAQRCRCADAAAPIGEPLSSTRDRPRRRSTRHRGPTECSLIVA